MKEDPLTRSDPWAAAGSKRVGFGDGQHDG